MINYIIERLGIVKWMNRRLVDPRDPELITHPLPELLHTSLLLLGQGWRDCDDADDLRDDPVLRVSVSTRKGTAPLQSPAEDDTQPTKDRHSIVKTLQDHRTYYYNMLRILYFHLAQPARIC